MRLFRDERGKVEVMHFKKLCPNRSKEFKKMRKLDTSENSGGVNMKVEIASPKN